MDGDGTVLGKMQRQRRQRLLLNPDSGIAVRELLADEFGIPGPSRPPPTSILAVSAYPSYSSSPSLPSASALASSLSASNMKQTAQSPSIPVSEQAPSSFFDAAHVASRPMQTSKFLSATKKQQQMLAQQHQYDMAALGLNATWSGSEPPTRRLSRLGRAEKVRREIAQMHAPPSNIADSDILNRGLIGLMNKGSVPSHVDLTSLLSKEPSPLVSEPTPLLSHREQFVKRPIFSAAEFGLTHSSTMKMDLMSPTKSSSGVSMASFQQQTQRKMSSISFGSREPVSYNNTKPMADVFVVDEEQQQQPSSSLISPDPSVSLPPIQSSSLQLPAEIDPRSYDQLLDEFSLHQFIIRRGKVLDSTPEFQSFLRQCQPIWEHILSVIEHMCAMLAQWKVPLAYVDGKKVAKLATSPPIISKKLIPTPLQLLDCLINRDKVSEYVKIPLPRFKGRNGDVEAATAIQATFRGFRQRRRYRAYLALAEYAIVLQRWWRPHYQRILTRYKLLDKIDEAEQEWRGAKCMQPFVKNWTSIKDGKRVIVHIPSLSYSEFQRRTTFMLHPLHNAALPRLFDLMDPNVELVYISPFPLDADASSYYMKLLQTAGVKNPEQRVKFIHPDRWDRLPPQLSLSARLHYSFRTMKRLASMFSGGRKPAYMVPSITNVEDIRVATLLGLPMLATEPALSAVYRCKSAHLHVFSEADANIPPCASDIYDYNTLCRQLARLICESPPPTVTRWVIKIDNEFGSRGSAYIDVSKLQSLSDPSVLDALDAVAQQQAQDAQEDGESLLRAQRAVFQELYIALPKKGVLCRVDAYPTWADFGDAILTHGCVVEACPPPESIICSPSVNLFIQPNGILSVQSVHENLFSAPFQVMGACSLRTEDHPSGIPIPFVALRDASLAIGRICFQKKITGYISIDYVLFLNEDGRMRMWAVDIDLYQTSAATVQKMVQAMGNCEMDLETGQLVPITASPSPALSSSGSLASVASASSRLTLPSFLLPTVRYFAYSGLIYHSRLATIRHSHFFAMCRQKGISFDSTTKTGTLFHLVDSLLRGMIGVVCVGSSMLECTATLHDVMDFIRQQITLSIGFPSPQEEIQDETNMSEVLFAIDSIDDPLALERTSPVKGRTRKLSASKKTSSLRKSGPSLRPSSNPN